MDFFKTTPNYDFMAKRDLAIKLSIALVVFSIISFAYLFFTDKLNLGIDFTGGTLIEVEYQQPVDLEEIRTALKNGGYGQSVVQHIGSAKSVLMRVPPITDQNANAISTKISEVLKASGRSDFTQRRVENVEAQVGQEFVEDAILALLFSLIGIFIYVALRFEPRLALSAVVATMHDLIITTGLVALLNLQFDLSMLAAILTVAGYSVNDTIVVFDRIRENFLKLRKETPVQVMNLSVNETLSRTLITGPTTLIVLFTFFILGGGVIDDFALTLIIGVLIGTFSSIYVASPVALLLGVSKADLMPVKKEGAEFDGRP